MRSFETFYQSVFWVRRLQTLLGSAGHVLRHRALVQPAKAKTAAHIKTTLSIRYCYGFHCIYLKPLDPVYSEYAQWIYKIFIFCSTNLQLEFTGHIQRLARKTDYLRECCSDSCGHFGLISH